MEYSTIVNKCLQLVEDKLNESAELQYHNMSHITYVLQMATQIAKNTDGIENDNIEPLQLAAVFHDAIYNVQSDNNEESSAEYAALVLTQLTYPIQQIQLVKGLILATKWNYNAQTILEKIIIDADLAHLHCEDYIENQFVNLYQEINSYRKLGKSKWIKECIALFSKHKYYTSYAQNIFNNGKRSNLEKLNTMNDEATEKSAAKTKKKKKEASADRGIETLFRVTLRNHTNLSQIADNKANTLISVNAIIISIVLSTLFPKFDKNQFLVVPAIILLALSIITVILAMIATIPRTTEGVITKDDILKKKGNLAFFGNFHRIPIEDYEWGIGELMKDRDYLYKSLTRDLYHLGKVLKKKYFYLRIAYFGFLANLIISSASFILSLHLNG